MCSLVEQVARNRQARFQALFSRQPRDISYRPDLNRANPSARYSGRDLRRGIEGIRLNEEIAGELFLRFDKRSIGNHGFAVSDAYDCRDRFRMQRGGMNVLTLCVELVAELDRFCQHRFPFLFGDLVEQVFVVVKEQQAYYRIPSLT